MSKFHFTVGAPLNPLLPSAALLLMALTHSEPAQSSLEQNEYGMDVDPHCSYNIKKSVMKTGYQPTGIVASTKGWDLEIYQNPETKSWTLLGKRNEAGANSKLCLLDNGIKDDYSEEKWYREYFR